MSDVISTVEQMLSDAYDGKHRVALTGKARLSVSVDGETWEDIGEVSNDCIEFVERKFRTGSDPFVDE